MRKIVEGEPESTNRWRVSHEDCPSGRDTRRRLYVERKDYGYVSHCFNCGNSGYVPVPSVASGKASDGSAAARAGHSPTTEAGKHHGYSPPKDASRDISEWSRDARAYVLKFGIKQEEIDQHKIAYSPSRNAIIYPIIVEGEIIGYSQRNFNPDLPKYISRTKRSGMGWISPYKSISLPFLVITEDILSAIKVCRIGYSMALLRTTMSVHMLAHVCSLYEDGNIGRVFVHLDNDNPVVRRNALSIVERVKFLGIPAHRIKVDKDPKKCSMDELRGYYG
jgi:hypothetical protein